MKQLCRTPNGVEKIAETGVGSDGNHLERSCCSRHGRGGGNWASHFPPLAEEFLNQVTRQGKKGYQLMTVLKKLQEVIQKSFPTQAKKEAAAGKPIIHILNPSACWTTTVATTVPPQEQ